MTVAIRILLRLQCLAILGWTVSCNIAYLDPREDWINGGLAATIFRLSICQNPDRILFVSDETVFTNIYSMFQTFQERI